MRVESGLSFLSFRCFDSEFVIFSFFPSRRYRRRHVPYCLRNSFIEIKINRRRRRRSITARLLLYKKSLLTHTHYSYKHGIVASDAICSTGGREPSDDR